jgi:hypothetical protein
VFNTESLSSATVTCRVEYASSEVLNSKKKKKKIGGAFVSFCLAPDESNDTRDTVQLLIVIRGMT